MTEGKAKGTEGKGQGNGERMGGKEEGKGREGKGPSPQLLKPRAAYDQNMPFQGQNQLIFWG